MSHRCLMSLRSQSKRMRQAEFWAVALNDMPSSSHPATVGEKNTSVLCPNDATPAERREPAS